MAYVRFDSFRLEGFHLRHPGSVLRVTPGNEYETSFPAAANAAFKAKYR